MVCGLSKLASKSDPIVYYVIVCPAAPVATSVLLNAPMSGGATLTMNGFNMGNLDLSMTSAVALQRCETSHWTSRTSLSCLAAAFQAWDGTVHITVGGHVGTGTDVFSFEGAGCHPHLLIRFVDFIEIFLVCGSTGVIACGAQPTVQRTGTRNTDWIEFWTI